jgi:hypothetical protein
VALWCSQVQPKPIDNCVTNLYWNVIFEASSIWFHAHCICACPRGVQSHRAVHRARAHGSRPRDLQHPERGLDRHRGPGRGEPARQVRHSGGRRRGRQLHGSGALVSTNESALPSCGLVGLAKTGDAGSSILSCRSGVAGISAAVCALAVWCSSSAWISPGAAAGDAGEVWPASGQSSCCARRSAISSPQR